MVLDRTNVLSYWVLEVLGDSQYTIRGLNPVVKIDL
jgi:hypothetical protein